MRESWARKSERVGITECLEGKLQERSAMYQEIMDPSDNRTVLKQ